MEEVTLKIQNAEDRKNIVTALANSGYSVRVEQKDNLEWAYRKDYFVIFKL